MVSSQFKKLNQQSPLTLRKMSLHDLLDRYMCAVEVSPRYAESLLRTVRKAEANGLKNICQLSADAVNKFLSSLPLSNTTRHNIRRELLTLWRYAFDCNLTDEYPARVRKIRPTYAPVEAWTHGQLQRLLDAAEQDETPVSRKVRLRRCDVLPAWIGLAYDSGMRFGDVHALTAKNLRNGSVAVVAHKTGKPLVRALSSTTCKHAATLLGQSPDGTLFKWALPRRRAILLWRKFLDEQGVQGSSKWLRRTAATQVERLEAGAATAFLQHSHPSLAARHYNDATQLRPALSPPPLRS